MSRRYIKYISIFTVMIYLFYLVFPLASLSIVRASSIDEKDIYKGIALALLLLLVSKVGKSSEGNYNQTPPDDIIVEPPIVSDSDVDLLAHLIYAESRGEPFEGQIAVGAVVMNRVKSSDFPNTVRAVIYQKGQFSPVQDGQINLQPNSNAYLAAEEAIKGKDPSRGALFFYNPEKAKTLWWLSQRETTVIIGNHVFAR